MTAINFVTTTLGMKQGKQNKAASVPAVRVGRPPVANPRNVRLSIALDAATLEALQARAADEGVPASEIARRGVVRELALARGKK